MPLKPALSEQFHAAMDMLADCIVKCPNDLWTNPTTNDFWDDAPDRPCIRNFWRIAFHAIYFTHLYMAQSVESFERPAHLPMGQRADFDGLWDKTWELDPYEVREDAEPVTNEEMLDYLRWVDALIDPTIEGLDLDSPDSGVPWYKNFPKLNHELLTLRHLQGHVGQLSELLMARRIDTDWVSRRKVWLFQIAPGSPSP